MYLHELDLRWHRKNAPKERCNAHLVRYADDFVVLARFIGEPIQEFLKELLEGKMELKLNEKKTRILNLTEPKVSLDFLGYTFRFDRDLKGQDRKYLNMFPSKGSLAKRRSEIRHLTRSGYKKPLPRLIQELNLSLTPWANYFSRGYPQKAFRQMDAYVLVRLSRFLANRSQRRMRVPQGMELYGWVHSLGLVRLAGLSQNQTGRKAGCGKSARPV